ncbi:MAG: cache domain-containing protein [Kiritimatiellales bacterium]|nr:cache domain-containing protein [Kiritimatiellota bacterium]MBL7011598.1 cache domain-containing protein [Kiritimatiellales bacterium]
MKLSSHADRTEKRVGIRAENLHKWIDGFFDSESFDRFLQTGSKQNYNPYKHRKYRHCAEALEDAYREFEGPYTREQIKAVFECHLRDDYDGYIPRQEDFESGAFTEKYHEAETPEAILSATELADYFKGKAYAGYLTPKKQKLSGGFYWRIVWPAVIAAVLFAASAFTIIVPLFRSSMMKQKREMIKELTATAASAIQFYIHQEQAGAMTRAEAQQQAAAEVSELRYGAKGKDYFWITDMVPRMIMHPYRPELVGQDLTDYTDREDKSGKKLFVEFVELINESNEGYLEYLWQWMDDPTRAEPKLSYVRGIPEWGWIIGTGVYIHDIEQEIGRISRNLLIADGVLALALIGLLINILFQSRRIELNRQQAETGLNEAKERYRALVESSNEGYLLEVGGQTVYSNHTLRRLTGRTETELTDLKPWELLTPDVEINLFATTHLKQVYAHSAPSAEFEARITSKTGETRDVQIATSRIFFSEKHGHIISFRPIQRGREQTMEAFYHPEGTGPAPTSGIPERIKDARTPGQVVELLNELPQLVRTLTDQGIRPARLRETIGSACDAAIEQFVFQTVEAAGKPDVPFVFLSLGSSARHEMTLFSDQDNALLFADVPNENLSATRHRFLELADSVCARLKQAGYPYCPGGIMAVNPNWCLSLSEWKQRFTEWIAQASPEALLKVNVFFDIRCACGDQALLDELRDHVQQLTAQHPEFFAHFARNCLGYKAPLGLFGRLLTGKHSSRKTIHLKECLKPLETFARIYAIKHGFTQPGTIDRVTALFDAGILKDETRREFIFVFDYLWQLRFFNQISETAALNAQTDELDITSLTDVERDNLQTVLARIPLFQTKLSYDFFGQQV